MTEAWHPANWRERFAVQQPVYADAGQLAAVEGKLGLQPPLVELSDVDKLKTALSDAAAGRALLLQGGDCAETFADADIPALARLFGDLSSRLPLPTIRVARIAGQFAKPRTIEGRVWRGEIVNGREALDPDPERMLRAFAHARATVAKLPRGLFTSHEALLLPYEQALVRRSEDGRWWWSGSGHFLWLGERTRNPRGAHAEFLRGLANPLGVKLGAIEPDELLHLLDLLDPGHEPGRLTMVVRMGDAIGRRLPPLMRAVRQTGRPVLWVSDPLHGNTERGGHRKVRRLPAILREASDFVAIARAEGVHPGGLHLEMTAGDVAEVVGGAEGEGWTSACDPRLNPRQAALVADEFARSLQQRDAA